MIIRYIQADLAQNWVQKRKNNQYNNTAFSNSFLTAIKRPLKYVCSHEYFVYCRYQVVIVHAYYLNKNNKIKIPSQAYEIMKKSSEGCS